MSDQQNTAPSQAILTVDVRQIVSALPPPMTLDTLSPTRARQRSKSHNKDSRAVETASEPPDFQLFIKLPVELQIMIWNAVDIPPRPVEVRHGCCKTRGLIATTTIPTILHINSMARREGLKRLTKVVDKNFKNPFYFNPAEDCLSFISSCEAVNSCRLCEDLVRNFTAPSRKESEPGSLYQITRHVAVGYDCFYRSAIREVRRWPNLRSLAVPLESVQRLRRPPVRQHPRDEYSNYQKLSKMIDFTHIQRASIELELLNIPLRGKRYIESPHVNREHRHRRRKASDRKDLILLF